MDQNPLERMGLLQTILLGLNPNAIPLLQMAMQIRGQQEDREFRQQQRELELEDRTRRRQLQDFEIRTNLEDMGAREFGAGEARAEEALTEAFGPIAPEDRRSVLDTPVGRYAVPTARERQERLLAQIEAKRRAEAASRIQLEEALTGVRNRGAIERERELAPLRTEQDIERERALGPIRTRQKIEEERALGPIRAETEIEKQKRLGPIRTAEAEERARRTAPYRSQGTNQTKIAETRQKAKAAEAEAEAIIKRGQADAAAETDPNKSAAILAKAEASAELARKRAKSLRKLAKNMERQAGGGKKKQSAPDRTGYRVGDKLTYQGKSYLYRGLSPAGKMILEEAP